MWRGHSCPRGSSHESCQLGDRKVYIPEFNRLEDRSTTFAFMKANPFAILVSNAQGIPFATHLPVLVDEAGDQVVVRSHMARANPHWKSMKDGEESLVIFHGPHAYI